jgi:hypothetical protein
MCGHPFPGHLKIEITAQSFQMTLEDRVSQQGEKAFCIQTLAALNFSKCDIDIASWECFSAQKSICD